MRPVRVNQRRLAGDQTAVERRLQIHHAAVGEADAPTRGRGKVRVVSHDDDGEPILAQLLGNA